MPYNSYIPPYYNYNSYYQPQMTPQMTPPTYQATQPVQAQQQSTSDIIWVQGEAGAKAYLVAPNTTVTLWDSETPTIYIKTSDGRGIPSMRVLDFTERSVGTQNAPISQNTAQQGKTPLSEDINALRAKYDVIEDRLTSLEDKYSSLSKKASSRNVKDSDNE